MSERLVELAQAAHKLSIEIEDLKDEVFDLYYRNRAAAYLSRLLRRVRPLSATKLADLLDDAVEQSTLTDAERDEILLADVVVQGKHRETGADVYAVVEVSWGVGSYDVERAVERSRLLSKLGTPALPVVAGREITKQAASLAEAEHVHSLIEGRRSVLET